MIESLSPYLKTIMLLSDKVERQQKTNEACFKERTGLDLPAFNLSQDLIDSVAGAIEAISLLKEQTFLDQDDSLIKLVEKSIATQLSTTLTMSDAEWEKYTEVLDKHVLQGEMSVTFLTNPLALEVLVEEHTFTTKQLQPAFA